MTSSQPSNSGIVQPPYMASRRPMVADNGHFLILVYTFFHNVEGKQRDDRLERADKRWEHWLYRLLPAGTGANTDIPELAHALDDTYFFLPYVRSLLFPETELLDTQQDGWQEANAMAKHLRDLQSSGQQSSGQQSKLLDLVTGMGVADLAKRQAAASAFRVGMLRLTLREDVFAKQGIRDLVLKTNNPNPNKYPWQQEEIPFRIDWADAILFPHKVGFLSLKVEVDLPKDAMTDQLAWFWKNAWSIFPPKLIPKPTSTSPHAAPDPPMPRLHKKTRASEWFEWRHLVEFLVEEFVGADVPPANVETTLSNAIPLRYTSQPDAQVYGSTFRLFGFVPVEGHHNPDLSCFNHGTATTRPFATQAEQVLFESMTGENSDDRDWQPASKEMKSLRQSGLISYWQGWQALLMWGNAFFLAEDSPFVRDTLRFNVEGDYFYLYLLTLFQEVRLRRLAGEIIRKGAALIDNLNETHRMAGELVYFRNLYWFRQVTARPVGTVIYEALQRTLDLDQIHRGVADEVAMLQAHFEAAAQNAATRAQRRVEFVVSLLTVVLLPVGALLQIFSNQLKSWPVLQIVTPVASQWITLGALVVLIAVWLILLLVRRDKDR